MLKIYFDWNCITHSKDKYPDILDIAEKYRDMFIFPFSNAHIRDILVSHKEENEYYNSDLVLLERICGKHYLLFEDGQMRPMLATPNEVIKVSGNTFETIQNLEFISPHNYSSIKDEIKKLLPSNIYKTIQGADPKNVITIIDDYIAKEFPTHNLESLLSLYQPNVGQIINLESRFKTMCLALDLFGFRPEKKNKQLMNIDTDACHIFYAGHCDIFVTADRKLRGKAEAIYRRFNYQTRILLPKEFESFIRDELDKEYSLTYMSEVIDEYGISRIENDGAHYKILPNHILGTFNVCHKFDEFCGYEDASKVGMFRYSFNNTPYLFYTEINHFFNLIESFLQPSEKGVFREAYVKPLLSKNDKITSTAKFTLNIKDFDIKIELHSDPINTINTPMMMLYYGNRYKELYNKFINKKNDNKASTPTDI